MDKTWKAALLPILLALGFAVPFYFGGVDVLESFSSLSFISFIELFLIMTFLVLVNAARLRMLLVGRYPSLTALAFCRLYLATELFSKITPAGSGALPAGLFLLRKYNVPPLRSTTAFVVSAGLDVFVLSAILFYVILIAGLSEWRYGGVFLGLGMLFSIAIFLVLAVVCRRSLSRFLILTRWKTRQSRLPLRWFSSFAFLSQKFFRSVQAIGKGRVLWALLGTAIYWCTHLSVLYWVAEIMGTFVEWPQSLLVQFASMGLGHISMSPGGAGVVELSAITGLSAWMSISMASSVVIVWRLFMQYFYIVVGAAALVVERATASHRY
jgi:glycosyltransferase 2 family protein